MKDRIGLECLVSSQPFFGRRSYVSNELIPQYYKSYSKPFMLLTLKRLKFILTVFKIKLIWKLRCWLRWNLVKMVPFFELYGQRNHLNFSTSFSGKKLFLNKIFQTQGEYCIHFIKHLFLGTVLLKNVFSDKCK